MAKLPHKSLIQDFDRITASDLYATARHSLYLDDIPGLFCFGVESRLRVDKHGKPFGTADHDGHYFKERPGVRALGKDERLLKAYKGKWLVEARKHDRILRREYQKIKRDNELEISHKLNLEIATARVLRFARSFDRKVARAIQKHEASLNRKPVPGLKRVNLRVKVIRDILYWRAKCDLGRRTPPKTKLFTSNYIRQILKT